MQLFCGGNEIMGFSKVFAWDPSLCTFADAVQEKVERAGGAFCCSWPDPALFSMCLLPFSRLVFMSSLLTGLEIFKHTPLCYEASLKRLSQRITYPAGLAVWAPLNGKIVQTNRIIIHCSSRCVQAFFVYVQQNGTVGFVTSPQVHLRFSFLPD